MRIHCTTHPHHMWLCYYHVWLCYYHVVIVGRDNISCHKTNILVSTLLFDDNSKTLLNTNEQNIWVHAKTVNISLQCIVR